jgi:hypothetical protein
VEPENIDQQFGQFLQQASGQFGALIAEATAPERFEYKLVVWTSVNDLARDGWQLMPFATGCNHEHWVMQRKLGAADAAEQLLRADHRNFDVAATAADGKLAAIRELFSDQLAVYPGPEITSLISKVLNIINEGQ